MSPKLSRLLFVAMVVTGASAPMLGAYAAGQPRTVDAYNMPRGFEAPAKSAYQPLEINKDDSVSWVIWEGEHTVTAKDSRQWGGTGSNGNLTPDTERYSKKFTVPGDYFYYCKIHGGINEHDELTGMWGVIHVNDPTPTTTAPPPPPPPPPPVSSATTTTTRPSATPPATSATAPTTRPTPTTAAPTTTAPKGDKDRKPKDEPTTTTATVPPLTPPPPPIDLPDEAIVPSLPSAGTTSNAAPGETRLDTPEGEAVALLKGKKDGGGDAKKLLIVSGLGLGVLGFGTAGYKYANRSSKYFPA